MKTLFKWAFALVAVVLMAIVFGAINAQSGTGVVMMTPFVLAGFTEDQSKSFSEYMGKQAADIQAKVKGLIDAAKDGELLVELKTLLKGDGKNAKGIEALIPLMQAQLDAIATEQKNLKIKQTKEIESLDFVSAIRELLNSEDFKNAKKDGFKTKSTFDVKADTGDITGDINRSVQNLTLSFAPERAQAFLPNCVQLFVGAEKNRVIWMDGAYTSNAGYVGEGVGPAAGDTGTAVEKGREMAKISAKLPLTTEMMEDADYIASAFKMKLQERALLFTDNEVYTGNGSDGVQPKHIYGIVGHSTAFSAATTGTALGVKNANIGDLVDAMILQAELSEFRGSNVIWMNPKDFFKFRTVKDLEGNRIFVKDINGTYTIAGLQVIRSTAVAANSMTIADKSKLELYWKRRPEVKFSQMDGTDFTDDMWTAVLFLRAQLVVETANKLSIIHCADIAAAVTAITAA